MKNSATGTHQRIRMQQAGQPISMHGTLVPGTYDRTSGGFSVSFDYQASSEPPLKMSREAATGNTYVDDDKFKWVLIGS